MPVDIGKRIRETRLSKGYTQEDVANALGITRQAVARWESGAGMPSTANLMALADFFQMPLSDLLGERRARRWLPAFHAALRWAAAYLIFYLFGYVAFYLCEAPQQIWLLSEWLLPLCAAVSLTAELTGKKRVAVSLLIALSVGTVLGTLWNTFVPVGRAGLRKGFVITFVCIASGVAAGWLLDRRTPAASPLNGNAAKWLRRAFCTAVVCLIIALTVYSANRLPFIRGADAAVADGFTAGAEDAAAGCEYAPGLRYHAPEGEVPDSGSAYKGWMIYWATGYKEGYASGNV